MKKAVTRTANSRYRSSLVKLTDDQGLDETSYSWHRSEINLSFFFSSFHNRAHSFITSAWEILASATSSIGRFLINRSRISLDICLTKMLYSDIGTFFLGVFTISARLVPFLGASISRSLPLQRLQTCLATSTLRLCRCITAPQFGVWQAHANLNWIAKPSSCTSIM